MQLVPEVVDFKIAYAKCLQKIPAVDDAVAVLREAIAAQPDHSAASRLSKMHNELGQNDLRGWSMAQFMIEVGTNHCRS